MLESQTEWPDKRKSLPYISDPFHIYYDPFAEAYVHPHFIKEETEILR